MTLSYSCYNDIFKIYKFSSFKPEVSVSYCLVVGSRIAEAVRLDSEVEVVVVGWVGNLAFCWPDCHKWEHSELAS